MASKQMRVRQSGEWVSTALDLRLLTIAAIGKEDSRYSRGRGARAFAKKAGVGKPTGHAVRIGLPACCTREIFKTRGAAKAGTVRILNLAWELL